MRTQHRFRGPVLGLLAFLLVLPSVSPAWSAQCEDVALRVPRHLNVLTINLAFFEFENRDQRLDEIARFAVGERVDVILAQEGVGGFIAGTDNSLRDLQQKLSDFGGDYELRTVFEAGLPGVLALANGILSRCEIRSMLFTFLPTTSEQIEFEGLTIPITRNAMMVRLKIPGAPRAFRRVNVYNTHLCAGGSGSFGGIAVSGCTVEDRGRQLEATLGFVRSVERLFSFFRARPHVVGGDFNIDNFRDGPVAGDEPFGIEKPLYDRIIGAGFTDAYAASQMVELEDLCDKPETDKPVEPFPGLVQRWAPDEHCTTGVSYLNPLLVEDFTAAFFDRTPRRIDYIFEKLFRVGAGEVVFNPNVFDPALDPPGLGEGLEHVVSDHAGVLVRLEF